MNISYNSRYKETDDYIIKAFLRQITKKDYNKITVKDICSEAGINRSSFYSHYVSIEELTVQYENSMTKQLEQIFAQNGGFNNAAFEKMFEFVAKNKNFYKAFLAANNSMFVERLSFGKFRPQLIKFGAEYGELCTATQVDYRMCFFGGGLKALCQRWLEKDCKETPAEMAKILSDEYNNSVIVKIK